MAYSKSLPELAYIIQSRTNSIYDLLNEAGLPQPSFSLHDGPRSAPARFEGVIENKRAQLLEAIDELRALILGPSTHVFFLSFLGPAWTATLHVIYKFRIAQNLPLEESLSYKELADRCGLTEFDTARYVRAAITLRIFEEPRPGYVRHNAASEALATTLLDEWIGFATEEVAPSALKVADVLKKYPGSMDPARSPFALANNSDGDKDLFGIIAPDHARVDRLSKAMSYSMNVPDMSPEHVVRNVPWLSAKLGDGSKSPKVVVDVGGSRGVLCRALLKYHPTIEKAIAMDLPEVIEKAKAEMTDDLDGRLELTPYNFFEKQTVSADVYFFRCVFHDWTDPFVVTILRNQIPALKPGATIIINERCLEPPCPSTLVKDQFAAACNIHMQLGANAKERTRDDWARLIAEADGRFAIKSIVTPAHSALSLIEVVWKGVPAEGLHDCRIEQASIANRVLARIDATATDTIVPRENSAISETSETAEAEKINIEYNSEAENAYVTDSDISSSEPQMGEWEKCDCSDGAEYARIQPVPPVDDASPFISG
ncbi:S-adenosyl-L-methionine-dependent methyltransferase [Xylariaceae sp. FL1272]|nr:S-adenosyl-L-methionine-dependent methyltransferase [Xylariaceae sp. FL1272]